MKRSAGLVLCLALVGVLGGAAFSQVSASLMHSQCVRTYSLLNPWLHCEDATHHLTKPALEKLQQELESYIREQKADGAIVSASVSFHDPDGDASFQAFGSERYAPGSLLKVPIMIAIYKQVQENPALLSRTLDFRGDFHSVQELVETMIVDSDNDAREVLLTLLQDMAPDGKPLIALSAELRLSEATPGVEDFLRVNTYASLLRTLYDASYLNKAMSQKALALLTRTRYVDGLVAGVPEDVSVAHKFGIREDRNQIHDCGIVYAPGHPYILCVMTKAASIEQGESVIREISRRAYAFEQSPDDE